MNAIPAAISVPTAVFPVKRFSVSFFNQSCNSHSTAASTGNPISHCQSFANGALPRLALTRQLHQKLQNRRTAAILPHALYVRQGYRYVKLLGVFALSTTIRWSLPDHAAFAAWQLPRACRERSDEPSRYNPFRRLHP